MERLIAERLLRSRMKKAYESAVFDTVPKRYYTKVESILNHRLGNYETGVKVLNLRVLQEAPGVITFKVEYSVDIKLPIVDPEDQSTYYETETEYREQTMTIDTDELEESKVQERMSYEDDIIDKVEDIALDELGPIKNLELMPSQVQGYNLYRCIAHRDNKGHWYAEKDGDIFAITYAQALGEEDIVPDRMRGLRQKLGRMLLPNHMQEDLTLDDDPEETDQKYSSAATSINSSKLPALFGMVKFEKGSLNLDYGGGRFDNVAEYLDKEYGATNLVYDKYNRTSEHNREVLNQVRKNGGADTVTCSNVLNVIAEESERLAVLRNCKRYLKSGGICYITVYEGNGTGEGAETKSGYQLNRKTKDYESEIKQVFSGVTHKGKLFICR